MAFTTRPEHEPLTWTGLVIQLIERRDLSARQAGWAMDRVMDGEVSPVRLAAFLVALRAKGESVAELGALAASMLEHAVRLPLDPDLAARAVDVVGTGGDRFSTVNISTMAALVVAGAGRPVVKHGNRAATSRCGSADVLEALGVRLDLPPARVAEVASEAGITFCFAGAFHPAMRHAAAARAELGVPTSFNFLGPLTNPGRPATSAVGVADARMAPLMAGVLAARGARALVFRGEEGLDELSTAGPSRVWRVADGEVSSSLVEPADVGLDRSPLSALVGGDAPHNARVVRDVLAGARGPVRDAVVLNAGAALAAAQAGAADLPAAQAGAADLPAAQAGAADLPAAISAGISAAAASIDSGAAGQALERWVAATRA